MRKKPRENEKNEKKNKSEKKEKRLTDNIYIRLKCD